MELYRNKYSDDSTPMGQYVFAHLNKIYTSVQWNKDGIYIPELEITLLPPYDGENIDGGNEKSKSYLKALLSEPLEKFNEIKYVFVNIIWPTHHDIVHYCITMS